MERSPNSDDKTSRLNATVINDKSGSVSILLLHRGDKVFFEVSVHAPNETRPRLTLSSDQGYPNKDEAIDEAKNLIKLKQQEIDATLKA